MGLEEFFLSGFLERRGRPGAGTVDDVGSVQPAKIPVACAEQGDGNIDDPSQSFAAAFYSADHFEFRRSFPCGLHRRRFDPCFDECGTCFVVAEKPGRFQDASLGGKRLCGGSFPVAIDEGAGWYGEAGPDVDFPFCLCALFDQLFSTVDCRWRQGHDA